MIPWVHHDEMQHVEEAPPPVKETRTPTPRLVIASQRLAIAHTCIVLPFVDGFLIWIGESIKKTIEKII